MSWSWNFCLDTWRTHHSHYNLRKHLVDVFCCGWFSRSLDKDRSCCLISIFSCVRVKLEAYIVIYKLWLRRGTIVVIIMWRVWRVWFWYFTSSALIYIFILVMIWRVNVCYYWVMDLMVALWGIILLIFGCDTIVLKLRFGEW